jgi:hypothetical protein
VYSKEIEIKYYVGTGSIRADHFRTLAVVNRSNVRSKLVRAGKSSWASNLEASNYRAPVRLVSDMLSSNVSLQFPLPGKGSLIGAIGVRAGQTLSMFLSYRLLR